MKGGLAASGLYSTVIVAAMPYRLGCSQIMFCSSFQYEVLFCIQEDDDTRLRMYVESLRAKFPGVDCSVRHFERNVSAT